MDEAAGIDDAIWDVSQGFFTEQTADRLWVAFSNPRRNAGYFFETFNKKREYWNTRRIDARDVEGTDKAIYDQIIVEYGPDSNQARVEIYGEFPLAEEGSFIVPSQVDEAFRRKKYDDDSAPIIMGIDPARSGADSTVIVVRKGRDLVAIERYHGCDTMETVGNIIDAIERFKPTMTCIDGSRFQPVAHGTPNLCALVEVCFLVLGLPAKVHPANDIPLFFQAVQNTGAQTALINTRHGRLKPLNRIDDISDRFHRVAAVVAFNGHQIPALADHNHRAVCAGPGRVDPHNDRGGIIIIFLAPKSFIDL